MSQKRKQRPPPIEDPPTAFSSESEEDDEEVPPSQPHATPAAVPVSSSGEEEDSSQEEEDEQPSTLRTSANPLSNPQPKFSSESESDTDSEPTRAKPKPTDQTQTQLSPAPAKSGSKRPAHFTEPKRAKKKPTDAPSASVANDETEEDGKKSGGQTKTFQRIWSLEDELCILKGMNEFFSKTGQDPYRNADDFHNFITDSLHVEVTSNQLKEKIRRLKKKFQNHLDREKKGLEPRSSKQHDEAVLEFSKKVWGGGAHGLVEKPKPNGKAAAKSQKKEVAVKSQKKEVAVKSPAKLNAKMPEKSSAPPESGNHDVSLLYREMACFQELDEVDMKRGLALIEESKRKELEGKWKILRLAEMEVLANRSLLIGEQIKLVSEALQSSNN